jgi:hypothetical protein
MKKIIRLTESDLTRIIKRVINEENMFNSLSDVKLFYLKNSPKSLEDLIEEQVNFWLHRLDPVGVGSLDKLKLAVGSLTWDKVRSWVRFKDNKTKENMCKSFIIDYVGKKYNSKIEKYYNKNK